MEDNALDFMKHIVPDDAAIATYTVEGTYRPLYCFVPADQPVDCLDVAACIEETLHILREAASAQSEPQGKAEDLIRNVLGLERRDILVGRDISEDDLTEIDLGYALPGQILSFQRVPQTALGFARQLYTRYQLCRMLDAHVSLGEVIDLYLSAYAPARGLPAFADWLQTECPLFRTFEDWLSDVYPEGDGRWFQFCTDRWIWELDNPDRTDRQDVS